MQIISNKISVPVELPSLSRPRLLAKLNNSLSSCNLTVVNGRAGTGKTMLAADFAHYYGRKVAWYKVDASDINPQIFFQYLVSSVKRLWPDFFKDLGKDRLTGTANIDLSRMAESFVYELAERPGDSLLIVIDDLHLIYDSEWVVPFFNRLAPLLPPEVHLMIISRILPPAPLWRLRSKQRLTIIDELELNFTEEEAVNLFARYRLPEWSAHEALKKSRGRASMLESLAGSMNIDNWSLNTVGQIEQPLM
jgi:LuxR family maltose regulon positive regulatory protein